MEQGFQEAARKHVLGFYSEPMLSIRIWPLGPFCILLSTPVGFFFTSFDSFCLSVLLVPDGHLSPLFDDHELLQMSEDSYDAKKEMATTIWAMWK